MKILNKLKSIFAVILISIFIFGCGKSYSPKTEKYIESINRERAHNDSLMEFAQNSPFNFKSKVEFHKLKYFDVDTNFIFKSKFYTYPKFDTLTIYGTKGEARETVRIGYLNLNYKNSVYKLNVYESKTGNGKIYHGIWFTDKTTNKETYGVGRYIDFKLNADSNYVYKIDFNKAYNPYCAYSPAYSCAIPTKEDFLNFRVTAGEKKFHD